VKGLQDAALQVFARVMPAPLISQTQHHAVAIKFCLTGENTITNPA
jgi:hypothetical protein